MAQRQTLFVSHGGGPLPLLGHDGHAEMIERLEEIRELIEKPSAILLISAHWEEAVATVTTGSHPSLIYDYSGFPEESYRITYPAPGEPTLAEMVQGALKSTGIAVQGSDTRGFDHGMFVPLSILYPDADVPVVQLSLVNSLSAEQHIQIGKALADLEYENLLVLGSGFTFHNLGSFFQPKTDELVHRNRSFETWIQDTLSDTSLSEEEREQLLMEWERAPYARFCHPREEHLLPLHLCYGVEQRAVTESFSVTIMGTESSFFLWR